MQVPAKPPKLSAPIDLDRVRALFADPARVAESDFLRREIASRMHERLQLVKVNPLRVVDAGCGTGPDLPALQKSYPAAQILGVDTSAAMLAAARGQAGKSGLSQLIGKLLPAKSGIDYL